MKPISFTLFLACFYCICYAQKETSNWFFVQNAVSITPAGVTMGLPTPNNGNFSYRTTNTAVSDAACNLLFACDGDKIIDKNLSVMPALAIVNFNAGYGTVLAQRVPGSSKYLLSRLGFRQYKLQIQMLFWRNPDGYYCRQLKRIHLPKFKEGKMNANPGRHESFNGWTHSGDGSFRQRGFAVVSIVI